MIAQLQLSISQCCHGCFGFYDVLCHDHDTHVRRVCGVEVAGVLQLVVPLLSVHT